MRDIIFYSACTIGAISLFALIIAFIFLKTTGKKRQKITLSEMMWTLIPFVMLVVMLLPIMKAYETQKSSKVVSPRATDIKY